MFNYQYVVCPQAIIGAYIWDSSWTNGNPRYLKIVLTSGNETVINIEIEDDNDNITIAKDNSSIDVKHFRNPSNHVFTNLLSIINIQSNTEYDVDMRIGTYIDNEFIDTYSFNFSIITPPAVTSNLTYLTEGLGDEVKEAFAESHTNLLKVGYDKDLIIDFNYDSQRAAAATDEKLIFSNNYYGLDVIYHELRHYSGCYGGKNMVVKNTGGILKLQFGPYSDSQIYIWAGGENNLSGYETHDEGDTALAFYETLYWCLVCKAILNPTSIEIETISSDDIEGEEHLPDIPDIEEEESQPHIPDDEEEGEPHIPDIEEEESQPYIPDEEEESQPHIPDEEEEGEPHIPDDEEESQPHIPGEEGEPYYPDEEEESQPDIPGEDDAEDGGLIESDQEKEIEMRKEDLIERETDIEEDIETIPDNPIDDEDQIDDEQEEDTGEDVIGGDDDVDVDVSEIEDNEIGGPDSTVVVYVKPFNQWVCDTCGHSFGNDMPELFSICPDCGKMIVEVEIPEEPEDIEEGYIPGPEIGGEDEDPIEIVPEDGTTDEDMEEDIETVPETEDIPSTEDGGEDEDSVGDEPDDESGETGESAEDEEPIGGEPEQWGGLWEDYPENQETDGGTSAEDDDDVVDDEPEGEPEEEME